MKTLDDLPDAELVDAMEWLARIKRDRVGFIQADDVSVYRMMVNLVECGLLEVEPVNGDLYRVTLTAAR